MLDTAPNNASNRSLRLLGRAKQAIKQAPGYDCFWPVSAGRHYGVRWSSRMQTLGQLECK